METPVDQIRQWTIPQADGIHSLVLDEHAEPSFLADDEVEVKIHAAALNYRDLMIAKGTVLGEIRPNIVAGSDGAGVVLAVGSKVTAFKEGDIVVTHLCPFIADDQPPTMMDISAGLGHAVDGTLQVHAPKTLDFVKASTLTCSGLTAWNAPFGLRGRQVRSGDWVLVQGTGGVSTAALQFAVAVGATVVATTSTDAKEARLEALGAKHVLNYRQVPTWGSLGRALTPDGRGFDFVVDVGGDDTLLESLNAIRTDGIIVATGLLGDKSPPVPMLAALMHACTVRGVILGTRKQLKDLVQFVEEKHIEPVVDDVMFELSTVQKAYGRLEKQQHFSKVAVRIW